MLSAGYFFDKTKLFAKCDEGSGEEVVKKVSKRVNGGYNGLADRLEKFAKVWKVLG
jgi:predicted chitinase